MNDSSWPLVRDEGDEAADDQVQREDDDPRELLIQDAVPYDLCEGDRRREADGE